MNKPAKKGIQKQKTDELAGLVAVWSLSTTRTLITEMFEVLLEEGLTRRQDRDLHLEILAFFLVNLERFASETGGQKLLHLWQPAVADGAIRLVLAELNGSSPDPENTAVQAFEYYLAAAAEYAACPELVAVPPDYEGSFTLLGKLGVRIARLLEKPAVPELLDIVSMVGAEGLAESGLHQKVVSAAFYD